MKKQVIYLAGPTASGKTDFAIYLAKLLNGEIVSCDSMQIYKYLNIGTAKPTFEEQNEIKHWMIDFVDPQIEYSVYDYVRDAKKAIEDISSRGKAPIVVGGTGLYMSSLLHERKYTDVGIDPKLTEQIEKEFDTVCGPRLLLDEIERVDPLHAEKLSLNDRKRIVRAVELIRTTGNSYSFLSDSNSKDKEPIFLLNYGDRALLYSRIEKRIDQMVKNGLLEEANYVYSNRECFKTASMAIGYKEFFSYFEGNISIEQAISDLKKATRHYAKRQLTWFRREKHIELLVDEITEEECYKTVLANIVR
ncbi:MAG: tRNA (adenosine(37)-N6)-dimethylallyltransferase MiaA [Oscillospiraceae bacterium]|nr:tRNA (adenosine(37)-N6)-dimethylallyltransferase MiaA [Oscillospiraceae bacterium]